MVILRHVPQKPSRETLALVGKGITFDSGGISLKPGDKMWEMKGDMAGAAAVLYSMRALGRLRPDVKVVGILCCAENLPDGRAQRPATSSPPRTASRSWWTTPTPRDACADRRARARRGGGRQPRGGHRHADRGGAARAGPSVAGVMGTDRELVRRLIRSGENHGEAFWSCRWWRSTASRSRPLRRCEQHRRGWPGGRDHRGAVPEGVRPGARGLGAPGHRGADVRDKDWKYYEAGAIASG